MQDLVKNTSLEAGLLVVRNKIPLGIHLLGSSEGGIWFNLFFWSLCLPSLATLVQPKGLHSENPEAFRFPSRGNFFQISHKAFPQSVRLWFPISAIWDLQCTDLTAAFPNFFLAPLGN